MYEPEHFAERRPAVLHAVLRAHPLATLVVHDADGLVADHVPLLLREAPDGGVTLAGHVARANPLWRKAGGAGIAALAVFQGVQHYISPNGYASKAGDGRVVPTWNYVVVHATGVLRARDDGPWLRQLLVDLTAAHEHGEPRPWRLDDAPPDYIDRLQGAVVGIDLAVTALAGKSKLSQNQPDANRVSLAAFLEHRGEPAARAMAEAIRAHAPR